MLMTASVDRVEVITSVQRRSADGGREGADRARNLRAGNVPLVARGRQQDEKPYSKD